MWGGVLEDLEGGVALEALREVLRALITDAVYLETANESQIRTSHSGR